MYSLYLKQPQAHIHICTTHSISLKATQLTHIDYPTFVSEACGSESTSHASLPLKNLIIYFAYITYKMTRIGLMGFPNIEVVCISKQRNPFSFLHRLNKLKAGGKERESIKSQRAWPSGVLGEQKREHCSCITVCWCACRVESPFLWQWELALPLVL